MATKPLSRILYTAEAVTEGGRAGHGRTTDGRLDLQLSGRPSSRPRPNPWDAATPRRVGVPNAGMRGPT